MNILEIDKTTYRQKLTRVIIGFIIALTLFALLFGSILIAIFSEQAGNIANVSNEVASKLGDKTAEPNNFKFNFAGVVLALLVCAGILQRLKTTSYFYEIYYVWQLKQINNLIYRKLKKIKKAVFEDHNMGAMVILNYYYISLKQVYFLDDNTLTMSSVNAEQQKFIDILSKKNINLSTKAFNKSMLKHI